MLTTDRLILRQWRPDDREPFAAMNADRQVMEFFPALLSRAESDQLADRLAARIEERGFGFWALELPGIAPFIGFARLSIPGFTTHFTPCVEIGWRLAPDYWGRGYASEAARRALQFGFDEAGFAEIVSFAAVGNRRSRAVMERIGMTHDAEGDFDMPTLPEDSPIRRYVLYRIYAADPQRI